VNEVCDFTNLIAESESWLKSTIQPSCDLSSVLFLHFVVKYGVKSVNRILKTNNF